MSMSWCHHKYDSFYVNSISVTLLVPNICTHTNKASQAWIDKAGIMLHPISKSNFFGPSSTLLEAFIAHLFESGVKFCVTRKIVLSQVS